jgi:hypothetical protein
MTEVKSIQIFTSHSLDYNKKHGNNANKNRNIKRRRRRRHSRSKSKSPKRRASLKKLHGQRSKEISSMKSIKNRSTLSKVNRISQRNLQKGMRTLKK